ncbi:MAG TPA: MFS transporter [Polyangium sp.]|nr:MFS transporter [Polyangium sp.]
MTTDTSIASTATDAPVKPFPRIFWIALLLELLERMAFYGVYINLSVYLGKTVGLTDIETGQLLGVFALVRSWVPLGAGILADRIGFRASLSVSFILYAISYGLLFLLPMRWGAWLAVMGIAVAGAFLKPVIPATVRLYSPEERRTVGFSYFYASVNAGSVVGKTLTKIVREMVSLRASMLNAIVACLVALGITLTLFKEPKSTEAPEKAKLESAPKANNPLTDVFAAAKNFPLSMFIILISGYYLLIEQFYQTFPTYIVRTFGETVPREYITLINPASIAILQVFVGRLTAKLAAPMAISLGVFVGAISMLLMGAFPSLIGACGSFFVFALAEMILSPRYYEYISSFAPKGREGMYMGIAIIPAGVGGLIGGILSGNLIAKFLPENGPKNPLAVWGTYAAIGVGCALLIFTYGRWIARRRERLEAAAH